LRAEWTQAFAALGKTPTGWSTFIPANFWLGILAMLGYRWATRIYGAGMQTAVRTAVVAWLIFWVIPMMAMQPMKLFPDVLLLWTVAVGVTDAAAGIILGAWLYDRARWHSTSLARRAYPQPRGIPS
ncbi:MAG TPA: hypothetical protein VFS20_10485, partial [Longimicrobium sp.]|nr:hypothetical protein [Longimicrobium sp.]